MAVSKKLNFVIWGVLVEVTGLLKRFLRHQITTTVFFHFWSYLLKKVIYTVFSETQILFFVHGFVLLFWGAPVFFIFFISEITATFQVRFASGPTVRWFKRENIHLSRIMSSTHQTGFITKTSIYSLFHFRLK